MRGHAPNITKKVESVILLVKGTNQKFSANQVRNHIKHNLKLYKLNENQIPSVRSIQDRLSTPENLRKVEKIRNSSPDKAWSIGSLTKYDLAASAIPILLAIQNDRRQNGQPLLTVGEARWVGRLSSLFEYHKLDLNQPESLNIIATWAQTYELREKVCNLEGVDVDTSDLDQGLSGDFSTSLDKWEWRLLVDAIRGHSIKDEQTFRTTMYTLETMVIEIEFLRYSLGKPDLNLDGWDMYVQILQCSPDSVKSVLRNVTPEQAKQFFISLREWVKQNPEWVKHHPRTGDEVSNDVKESMKKDCSQIALKIVSSIKKSKGKKDGVKEDFMSVSSIAAAAVEGFKRHLGEMVDKEDSDERTKQSSSEVKDAGT
jgi:hypothetical protein